MFIWQLLYHQVVKEKLLFIYMSKLFLLLIGQDFISKVLILAETANLFLIIMLVIYLSKLSIKSYFFNIFSSDAFKTSFQFAFTSIFKFSLIKLRYQVFY